MTEEDISLANAIVDLLENFNKVFFNNYWDNNYNPFSSYSFFKDWRNSEDEKREVLENGENKQCYQYVKNKFDDIKKEFNKIENSNCDSLRNSINLLNFQTELNLLNIKNNAKLNNFLCHLLDFAKIYGIYDNEYIKIIKQKLSENADLENKNKKLIGELTKVRSNVSDVDQYKLALISVLKKTYDAEYFNNFMYLRVITSKLSSTTSRSIDSTNCGYSNNLNSELSDEEQNLILAYYTDSEIQEFIKKQSFKNGYDNKDKYKHTFNDSVQRLLQTVNMFSSKNKYTGLEIPFSYKGKEAINIIQDKNNCEYIGNFKWKCNRGENCFIGFESKPFGDMSGDSDLENLLDSLIAKLSNKKFNINELNKENNEIIKKILTADFYCEESDKNEASGINIGWYYEDGDKKKLNEFKIFTKYSQYKSKGKTPTNYLEKKNESEKTDDTTGLKSVISEIENGKSFMNGHHIIGSEWARANIDKFLYEDANGNIPIKFYNENEAPVILLRDTYEDTSHQTITKKQGTRRGSKRKGVSYSNERKLARKELQEIVVSAKNIGLNINKLSNEDFVYIKILQTWELHQIEVGLNIADNFYKNLKQLILEKAKEDNVYYKNVNQIFYLTKNNIKDVEDLLNKMINIL